jgi:RNA polymerase sigma-70 factor (ECF subfamily)
VWNTRPDEELIAALARDPEAFTAFYRRHVDDVLGFLARRTGDPELAADLTAEVFATVLLQARRYRGERGTPRVWLLSIAANKQRDGWRRAAAERRARRRLGVRDVAVDGDDIAYIEARGREVEALLCELPEEQRSAVRGRVIDDRSYDELAAAAGVSSAAVRQRVSRGLTALRDRLGRDAL